MEDEDDQLLTMSSPPRTHFNNALSPTIPSGFLSVTWSKTANMPSRLGKWVHVIGERGVRAVQKDNLNNCKERGPGVATEVVEIDDEAISGGKEMDQLSECLSRASAP